MFIPSKIAKIYSRLKFNNTTLILISLVSVSACLSLYGQPDNPPGFFRDEAGIGYSAYSVLKTGRDDWGNFLPLHFKALGDYPPGIYNYFTIPFVATVGLTELAARMAGIIAGMALIPLTYYLVNLITKNNQLSLLSSAIMILSPWFVVQARSGSEPLLALVFVYLGLIFWHKFLSSKNKKFLVLMALVYFLAIFTYNAVKPILFLIHLLFTWYVYPSKLFSKISVISTAAILLFSFLSVYALQGAAINYESGNIFKQVEERDFVVEYTREGLEGVPTSVSRLFHNKFTSLLMTAGGATLTYLDSEFLFFDGGLPDRYKIPYSGVLLLGTFPLMIFGLIGKRIVKPRQLVFWMFWLFIGIAPGVISINFHPHVKRTLFMYLPFFVITAAGILELITMAKPIRKILSLLIILLLGFNFSLFLNYYFVHSRYVTVHTRSYGFKELFAKTESLKNNYDSIEIWATSEVPEVFYFYFYKIDPRLVQARAAERNNMFDDVYGKWELNGYVFSEGECPPADSIAENVLYVTRENCVNLISADYYTLIDTVTMPDSSTRFMLFEISQTRRNQNNV